MAQVTIYLDDNTERLVRLHVLASGESASKWVAEAVKKRARSEWPADVLALLGSWKDEDFPDLKDLRPSAPDLPREDL